MLRVLTRLTPVKSLVNYDIHIEDDACFLEEGCKLSFDMLWCYPETNKKPYQICFCKSKNYLRSPEMFIAPRICFCVNEKYNVDITA